MKEEKEKEFTIQEITDNLQECEKLKNDYLAGWQRARADFLNYKKEEMERIGELIKWASEEFILKILPILDNFELATKEVRSMKSEDTKIEEMIKGFLQIKNQIQDFLKTQGVEEIDCLGQKFDPNFHEVMEEKEAEGKDSGIVIEEVQKGYMIQDRLLRPARVKISK
jgi:molecular chaperone GrpE